MKSRLATASFRWQEMGTNLLIFQGFFISLDCVLNNIAILVDTEKKKTKNKLSQPGLSNKNLWNGKPGFHNHKCTNYR